MAVQILSQSYGPRKPLIECTADSLSDLEGLVCAEGSKATVGGTEYVLDRVNGWVEPGSGGGGGGSGVLVVTATEDADTGVLTLDKTASEIYSAMKSGGVMVDAEEASYGVFPFVRGALALGVYNFSAIAVGLDGSVEGTWNFQAETGTDYPTYTPST